MLALVAVWWSALPWPVCCLISVALLGGVAWRYPMWTHRSALAIVALINKENSEGWALVQQDGRTLDAALASFSLLSPLALFLHFKTKEGKRVNLMVLPHQLASPIHFHAMLVALRLKTSVILPGT